MKFDTQAIHRSGTESATHSRRAYNIMAGSRGIARFTESTEYCSNMASVTHEGGATYAAARHDVPVED
uniref:SFRICE_015643 n=1 Tax=Spodoptera frugiperda TaxID=7108 RepID=A0A2H1VLR8_SPOFR